MHSLIESWRQCNLDHPPFYYPGDAVALDGGAVVNFDSLSDYASSMSFGKKNDSCLHVGLLPTPYMGNLKTACAVVLMLNPGLSPSDYFSETKSGVSDEPRREFRNALIRNLRQDFRGNEECPFVFLDPRFSWHSGFEYWEKRFRDIAEWYQTSCRRPTKYADCLKWVGQRVAAIELVPYHARTLRLSRKVINNLDSVRDARAYVRDILVPKVQSHELVLIAARAVKQWELLRHKSVIKYNRGEARAAFLSKRARQSIIDRLSRDMT